MENEKEKDDGVKLITSYHESEEGIEIELSAYRLTPEAHVGVLDDILELRKHGEVKSWTVDSDSVYAEVKSERKDLLDWLLARGWGFQED